MDWSVQLISAFMAMKPSAVWEMIRQTHPDMLTGTRSCHCGETKCFLNEVAAVIRQKGEAHFVVSFEEEELSEISYGHLRNFGHSLLSINRLISDINDAERWVEPFLKCRGFREAWVLDEEYSHWQNAEDPLEYTTVGRSYAGLPMKSNEAPPPLEQMIIDTSGNPGRRVLREGYVEAVGAVMWLGEQFWQVTGTRKEDVIAQDSLRCEELPSGVLHIQAFDQPFTTDEGEQGRVQERLRSLLFPPREDDTRKIDCEGDDPLCFEG